MRAGCARGRTKPGALRRAFDGRRAGLGWPAAEDWSTTPASASAGRLDRAASLVRCCPLAAAWWSTRLSIARARAALTVAADAVGWKPPLCPAACSSRAASLGFSFAVGFSSAKPANASTAWAVAAVIERSRAARNNLRTAAQLPAAAPHQRNGDSRKAFRVPCGRLSASGGGGVGWVLAGS